MASISKPSLLVSLLLAMAGCSANPASPDTAKQEATIGEAALTAGTPDIALHLADDTLTHNPDDAGALTRRGLALTAVGRLEEARESLRKAVASQPRNTRALLALGRVELPVDPAAAEAQFRMVLRQEPQNAAALNDMGIARDLQGHHADAEPAYRAALTASPDMTAAQVNLALCLAIRGHGSEAIALLRPMADGPVATQKTRENFAAVLAMSGERGEAERILAANMAVNEIAPALDLLASARIADATVTR
jgi:Flp pilus assembly protein TadD